MISDRISPVLAMEIYRLIAGIPVEWDQCLSNQIVYIMHTMDSPIGTTVGKFLPVVASLVGK